ncbi:CDP-alcohol phosphatidyltransferase family protein [Chloroflexota bacterium]
MPFILAGIILFYFIPFLDWSDGPLARVTKQTSVTGDILDPYGAYAGWGALWAGMGLYLASKSGEVIFFYLAPVIPVILALSIIPIAKNRLYDNYIV